MSKNDDHNTPSGKPASDAVREDGMTDEEFIDAELGPHDAVAEAEEWLREAERMNRALSFPGDYREPAFMRRVRALLDALEAERLNVEWMKEIDGGLGEENVRLRALLDKAEEGLEPFAKVDRDGLDEGFCYTSGIELPGGNEWLDVQDFDRARHALDAIRMEDD